jgi:hypothetical protein
VTDVAPLLSLKCKLYADRQHRPCSGTIDDGTGRLCECRCHAVNPLVNLMTGLGTSIRQLIGQPQHEGPVEPWDHWLARQQHRDFGEWLDEYACADGDSQLYTAADMEQAWLAGYEKRGDEE